MNVNPPLPFDPEFLPLRADERRSAQRHARRRGPRRAVGAPGYLSVVRTSEELGIQPRSVIYLIGRGLLHSVRLGRAHFIPTSEVDRYRKLRRERAARSRRRATRSRRLTLVR